MTALLVLGFALAHAGIAALLLCALEMRRRWREADRLAVGCGDQVAKYRAGRIPQRVTVHSVRAQKAASTHRASRLAHRVVLQAEAVR